MRQQQRMGDSVGRSLVAVTARLAVENIPTMVANRWHPLDGIHSCSRYILTSGMLRSSIESAIGCQVCQHIVVQYLPPNLGAQHFVLLCRAAG
jgi:hypothetical protein